MIKTNPSLKHVLTQFAYVYEKRICWYQHDMLTYNVLKPVWNIGQFLN